MKAVTAEEVASLLGIEQAQATAILARLENSGVGVLGLVLFHTCEPRTPAGFSTSLRGAGHHWSCALCGEEVESDATTIQDVSKRYAKLFHEHATDKAFEAVDREALRAVTVGEGSAIHILLEEIPSFLTRNDNSKLRKMKNAMDAVQFHPGAPPRAMALEDRKTPVEPAIFIRGNSGRLGKKVKRKFLAALSFDDPGPFKKGSGRLEMAEKIGRAENPLTARVWVNRVWRQHFGEGIVRAYSAAHCPARRPKTIVSRSELAPSRLPP